MKNKLSLLLICFAILIGFSGIALANYVNAASLNVRSVRSFVYTVKQNSSFNLPTKTTVYYTNKKQGALSVSWSPKKIDTKKLGVKYAYGKVRGYSGKVVCKVTVVKSTGTKIVKQSTPVKIKSVKSFVYTINQNSKFSLPSKTTVYYTNKKTGTLSVSWSPKTIDTTKAGVKYAYGKVTGYSGKVVCKVTVKAVPVPEPADFDVVSLE